MDEFMAVFADNSGAGGARKQRCCVSQWWGLHVAGPALIWTKSHFNIVCECRTPVDRTSWAARGSRTRLGGVCAGWMFLFAWILKIQTCKARAGVYM